MVNIKLMTVFGDFEMAKRIFGGAEKAQQNSRLDWIDLLRSSIGVGVVAMTLAIGDLAYPETLQGESDGLVVIGLLVLAYLGLCGARAMALWRAFNILDRQGTKRRDAANPFGELFIYLLTALGVLCLASAGGSVFWPWPLEIGSSKHLGIYVGLIFLAFVPLAFAIRKHNLYTHQNAPVPHHISNGSLLLASVLILLVGGLAWAAGERKIQMAGSFGPTIMLIVLFFFLMFIAVPYVHSYLLRRSGVESKSFDSPALNGITIADPSTLVSWLDTFLVRHIAPLTGATQVSKITALPHVLLISIFLPLTFMGFALPAPFGLIPIFFALLLAVSLGRRWSWVENDRETAMRLRSTKAKHIQVGFSNDLRDEALLGYLFLFVLIPLALRQMQLWMGAFGDTASEASMLEWASFFGTELAKAVPIVDWADIYGIQADLQNFNTQGRFSQHLIFSARLMVDLVVIAALLQAFSIMQRNSAQMQLFREGQLDLLDPFTEQAHFERGVRLIKGRATTKSSDNEIVFGGKVYGIRQNLLTMFEEHAENAKKRNGPNIPYDLDRLGELLGEEDWPKGQALVEFLKGKYSIQVGSASLRLIGLSKDWDAKKYFDTRLREFDGEIGSNLRHQRILLERIANELLNAKEELSEDALYAIAGILSNTRRRSEMFNAKSTLFKLLARQPSELAVAILTCAVVDSSKFELADLNQFEILSEVSERQIRQSVDDVRTMATEALEQAANSDNLFGNPSEERARLSLVMAALEAIAVEGIDTKEPRNAAKAALERLEEKA